MRILLVIIIYLVPLSYYCQDGTYLLILDGKKQLMLSSDSYKEHESSIKIDSSKHCEPCWYQVWLVKDEKILASYDFRDSSSIDLGKAYDLLQEVEIGAKWTNVGDYSMSLLKADSLRETHTKFFVQPHLLTDYKYYIDLTGELDSTRFDGLQRSQIDSLMQQGKIDIWNDFYKLYPEIKRENINLWYFKEVRLSVFLKEKKFNFGELDKMRVIFDKEDFIIKDREYIFTTIEMKK